MNKRSLPVILLLSTFMAAGGGAAVPDESTCPKLVMAHWMPQLILPAFALHKEFRDLPLIGPMQFTGDPIQQMREAKAGGIDAFSVCSSDDLGWCKATWNLSIEAADLIDGFFVCPAICNGIHPANLASTIEWVKAAKGHRSPLRVDGKCVISSYNWGNTTKDQMVEFRKKVKEATGEDIFIMADIDGEWHQKIEYSADLNAYPEQEKAVLTAASGADMVFLFWSHKLPLVERTAKISRDAGVLFAGATAPGYWRPEHEIFVPFEFTSRLRGHLASNIQYGARWLHLTTWNDYSENTHVQPSGTWGDTRISIIKFYGDLLKGIPIKETRFFVSTPSEARLGVPFGVEALVLQPSETPVNVTVRLVDGEGKECGEWVGKSNAGKDSAATPEFKLTTYPQGRFVRPIVDFQTAGGITKQVIGAPITIWPDVDRGLVNRQMISVSDKSVATFDEISLSFDEEEAGKGLVRVSLNPRVKGSAEFEPWAEVHLLAGDIVVKRILRNDSLEMNWPVNDLPIHWRFYNFPRTYQCGFVTPRLVTMNGRIAYGDPLWIAPPEGGDLAGTANIPMTEVRENVIVDNSLFTNHLRIAGDVKAVHPMTEAQSKSGLWVSPAAQIEMHPNTLPTGSFTLKLSLKPDAIKGLQAVIDNTEPTEYGGIQFRLSILPDGRLQFIRDNFECASTNSLVAGQWNDITLNFDGTTFAFSIDGKPSGEKTLDKPSESASTIFFKMLNIGAGRINPRLRSAIASSYSGGMADFSIISGSDLPQISATAPLTLVSLDFGNIGDNRATNTGTLGGVLPFPNGAQTVKETPPGESDRFSLQISGWSKTARSSFEIPMMDAGTISFWLKPAVTNDSNYRNLLDIGKGEFSVYAVGTDILVRTPTDEQRIGAVLTAGKWEHFAFTFDSAKRTGSIILNGKSMRTLSIRFPLAGGALAVSATDDIGAASFDGLLGNIRILNARSYPKDVASTLMR